jgi:hypothetical protein
MDSGGRILMNKERCFPTPSFAARRESLSQLAAIAEKIAESNNNTTTTTNTINGNNNMTSTSTTTTSISEALRRNKRPSWMMMTEMVDNSTTSVAVANNNSNPLAALLANGGFPSAGQQQHALANSLTGAVMEVMGPRQFKRTKFDHLTTNNLLHNPSPYDDDNDNDGGAASADDEQEQQDDVGSSGDDAGEEEEEEEENDDQQEGEDEGEVGVRFREYQAGKCNDFYIFFYSQSLGVSTIDDLLSRVNALTVVLPLHPSFILRNLVRKIRRTVFVPSSTWTLSRSSSLS